VRGSAASRRLPATKTALRTESASPETNKAKTSKIDSTAHVAPEGKGQPKPARGDAALYTPSDDDLAERVRAELQTTGNLALKKLQVSVQTQLVTLTGVVPSSVELLMALHLVARVPGVRNVKHRVEIVEVKAVNTNWADLFDQFIGQYCRQLAIAGALLLSLFLGWYVWSREPGPPLAVYQATGLITLAGKPIEGGLIQLHPYRTDFQMPVKPRGTLKKDGTFTLMTFNPNDGAPAGEYLVTVTWNREVQGADGEVAPGPNVLPEIYSKPDTSNLKVKIVAGEPNKLPSLALIGEQRIVAPIKGQNSLPTSQVPVNVSPPQPHLSKPSVNIPLFGE